MFTLGQWKNFEELEDSLSLDELYEVAGAIFEQEDNKRKFAASLKGINLDEERGKAQGLPTFEDMKKRAQAIINGEDPNAEAQPRTEQAELRQLGIITQED